MNEITVIVCGNAVEEVLSVREQCTYQARSYDELVLLITDIELLLEVLRWEVT